MAPQLLDLAPQQKRYKGFTGRARVVVADEPAERNGIRKAVVACKVGLNENGLSLCAQTN